MPCLKFKQQRISNGTNVFLLKFLMFKGERIKDDYIKKFRPRTCMAMQNISKGHGQEDQA
jgi:hypothetical protein